MRYMVLLLLLQALPAAAQYDRKNWGSWAGGCNNTRNQVLARDAAKGSVRYKTEKRCAVDGGLWSGPYTGELFTDPRKLDIDHTVPLKAAYDSGARTWTRDKKRRYFNDLTYQFHIIAVKARANRQKGSKGPDKWLPAVGRCEYVERWLTVKGRWNLTLTVPETRAIIEVIKKCD